ncbi:MAG TPA: preprotein translocase subunit SecA [Candidatus Avimonoglobus intestinipullorum]|uniref:Protein translocase subunit SecA n=1 Tax=Candidatus Avimonoglobus intestinipullorum TaxID=2840699 RepID=A0A9D1LVP9_9FIRM|nr:preprotein translocase subunit SecA [Candidatus Avimonoglobus intestinipullorum]
MGILDKLFGSYSDRELKRVRPIADRVLALDEDMQKLSDAELKAKTAEFKERLAGGETLDDLLPEAFAVMREASWRVLGMKHFPVQVIGGVILHQGRIAEMKTGEGKTLVSTLPAYLNALTGKGVHIVTVNDYLAKRDSEWMGKVYRFLGLTVGLIIHDLDNDQRREAYAADVTYGTNNELGFDYLRDNMVIYKEQMVQRGHNYAIVDEVDSILIDEARTPLIISGMGEGANDLYRAADAFVKRLKKLVVTEHDDKQLDEDVDADYIVDEKAKTAVLTDSGIAKAEQAFGIENLSDPANMKIQHHINQALQANGVMHRDKQYVVTDGQVMIVDEFTGRIMPGRRYSDGLHQAIEAKEGVKVENESRTLATITFQNFFRLYKKLSGMTGTALTEEEEFQQIYRLDVVAVPTNKPIIRIDEHDSVYKTEAGKFKAVIEQIKACNAKGQPVLVGTVNIDKSELLSGLLKRQGIKHEVLNAKFHAKEAEIVAQAGKKGAVTIATNMAGRGTDIILGGNAEYMAKHELAKQGMSDELIAEATGYADTDDEEIIAARKQYQDLYNKFKEELKPEQEEVIKAGGLFIIGTERHESRRIDNQLRGRSGRQGDPGASRFFLSLEDDLMRIFGSDRVKKMVESLGLPEDEPIEAKMLTKAIENAQKNLESRNFDARKHVLQYDEVMNEQRKIIYKQRQDVLDGTDLSATIKGMMEAVIDSAIADYIGITDIPEEWNLKALTEFANNTLDARGEFEVKDDELDTIDKDEIKNRLMEIGKKRYAEQEETFGASMRELERVVMLRVVDTLWMDHLDEMEHVKREIGLRAYGQHDPVVEYKMVGSELYAGMLDAIKRDTVRYVLFARPRIEIKREQVAKPMDTGGDGSLGKQPAKSKKTPGRNDPCPCGSGKKYKHCCGK